MYTSEYIVIYFTGKLVSGL